MPLSYPQQHFTLLYISLPLLHGVILFPCNYEYFHMSVLHPMPFVLECYSPGYYTACGVSDTVLPAHTRILFRAMVRVWMDGAE